MANFRQATAPTAFANGDVWYDSSNGDKQYFAQGGAWDPLGASDTDFDAYPDIGTLSDTDKGILNRSAGGCNFNFGQILKRNAAGDWAVGSVSLIGGGNGDTATIGSGTAFNTGGAGIALRGISTGYNDGGIEFYTGPGATGDERARLNSSGQFLVGTPSSWATNKFEARSSGAHEWAISGYGTQNIGGAFLGRVDDVGASLALFYYGSSSVGSITTNGSSTAYNTSSDYRLKDGFRPLEDALAKLMALNPGTFEWKDTGATTDGFLAHEYGAAIPGGATGVKDGMREERYPSESILDQSGQPVIKKRRVPDYQGIDQSKAVPVLVAALQIAIRRIEALEARS